MDKTTRCHCGGRKVPALDRYNFTLLLCLTCDHVDPMRSDALKWANGPLAASAK